MYFDLNLKHLKVFYYVAKHLSFTRAAQELFVTQPAVAMQIDALEKHYGVRFFTRRKRQLALTEAGEALYEYAERIMQLAFEAHRTILDMKEYPCGVLKMGTTKTWARYLMPSYILRFQKRYPEIQIELQDGSSEDMAMSVSYGQNDIAIVARVPYDPRLDVIPFPGREKDQLVLVVHPKHRLATRKRIHLREIVDEPLIIRGRGSGIRDVVMRRAEELGLQLSIMLEAGSVDFIKAMVMQGAGITILTTVSVEEYVQSGALKAIELADPGMWLDVDMVVRKEGYRPFAVRSFLEFLPECSEKGPLASTEEDRPRSAAAGAVPMIRTGRDGRPTGW
jgi:DNA-binding transcriptional LysR family regulator